MGEDDTWASVRLANLFADEAYATVKGYVRTYVMHRQLLEHLPPPPAEAQRRVTLLRSAGENAEAASGGWQYDAVLCHGVLGYLDESWPMVDQLCRCAAAGGIVSVMTGNANASAVRPAMERRWDDALASSGRDCCRSSRTRSTWTSPATRRRSARSR